MCCCCCRCGKQGYGFAPVEKILVVCSARSCRKLDWKNGDGGLTWAGSGWAGFAGSVRERGVLELVELGKRLWALGFLVVEA
jgi:hypothetical protein